MKFEKDTQQGCIFEAMLKFCDRRTDGRTDGGSVGRTDGRTDQNQYAPDLSIRGGIKIAKCQSLMYLVLYHFVI